MKKIFFSITLVLTLLLAAPISSYATNNDMDAIGNGVRNIINNAEDKMEDGAKNITQKSKDTTNSMGDAAGKAGDAIKNTAKDMKNGVEYTAKRTASETENAANNMMNPTTWAWIVIGVLVVAIVAIFWYFIAQARK